MLIKPVRIRQSALKVLRDPRMSKRAKVARGEALSARRGKYRVHEAGDDGWSEWETPVMEQYRLACCDCGLVHDFDFRALRVTKFNPDGTWEATKLGQGKYRVEFRVRRNIRSTAAVRRETGKRG